MRFLTCEPNFKMKPDYEDEADNFFNWPLNWLAKNIPTYPTTARPVFVLIYSQLSDQLGDFLDSYRRIASIYNSGVCRILLIMILLTRSKFIFFFLYF